MRAPSRFLQVHDPLLMEIENGQTVFFATLGRSAGGPIHALIRGVLRGTVRAGLVLDIADMGGPNHVSHRHLRGLVQVAAFYALHRLICVRVSVMIMISNAMWVGKEHIIPRHSIAILAGGHEGAAGFCERPGRSGTKPAIASKSSLRRTFLSHNCFDSIIQGGYFFSNVFSNDSDADLRPLIGHPEELISPRGLRTRFRQFFGFHAACGGRWGDKCLLGRHVIVFVFSASANTLEDGVPTYGGGIAK